MMASKTSELGLEENVEGALCYLLGFVTGIILYVLEEDNEFVRFHAVQSTIVFGGIFIASFILGTVVSGMAGSMFLVSSMAAGALAGFLSIISTLIWLLGVILWLLLMFKAYKGERYKLPIAGDLAENFLE